MQIIFLLRRTAMKENCRIDIAELGRRIRQSRIAQNMSQMELAEICGISVPYVSDIERGKKCRHFRSLRTGCFVWIFPRPNMPITQRPLKCWQIVPRRRRCCCWSFCRTPKASFEKKQNPTVNFMLGRSLRYDR